MEGMERMLRYALQLSYLNQLHKAGKITEAEYLRIRKNLMKNYGVVSDILAGWKYVTDFMSCHATAFTGCH